MVRGGRGEAVLTRYEVGDGEDGDGPPHGARLGLLHQIVHALHPLPHLGLRGGARGGGAAGVEPGQVGHFLLGFTVDGGGRARGGGSASSTAISNFRAFFFFFSILDFP
jgi:hypothetical protein